MVGLRKNFQYVVILSFGACLNPLEEPDLLFKEEWESFWRYLILGYVFSDVFGLL